MGVADIHPPESLPQVVAEFEARFAATRRCTGAAVPPERRLLFPRGRNAALVEINGRSCAVGFFRKITERKRARKRWSFMAA